MRAFAVLGLVFSIPSQETGLGKRRRNDLFCVECDVKPQLPDSNLVHMTSGGNSFNDFPEIVPTRAITTKIQRRLLSFSRPWPWACFLNGPNAAASIAPTVIRHRTVCWCECDGGALVGARST